MCWDFLGRYRDGGLLFLRIGLGLMFILHGWGKLMGGPLLWQKLGAAIGNFGITFYPHFFGFLAAITETLGGVCLILGILFRPACFFLMIVMIVATTMHLKSGDGLQGASHAIEMGIVFLSLMFIGPGAYSLGEKIRSRRKT